jgi:hypothetical protein
VTKLGDAKFFFVQRFGQVGVQVYVHVRAKRTGQRRALTHEIRCHTKRATRRDDDAAHGKAPGIVEGFDDAATVAQNGGFVLGGAVGRKAALAFAQAH